MNPPSTARAATKTRMGAQRSRLHEVHALLSRQQSPGGAVPAVFDLMRKTMKVASLTLVYPEHHRIRAVSSSDGDVEGPTLRSREGHARRTFHYFALGRSSLPGERVPQGSRPLAGSAAKPRSRSIRAPQPSLEQKVALPLLGQDGRVLGVLQVTGGPGLGAKELRFVCRVAGELARVVERLEGTGGKQSEALATGQGRVLSVVAHELGNPLNTILLSTSLLLRELPPQLVQGGAPSGITIDRIVRSAKRMTRLIADLVDVQAIDRGQLSLAPSTWELGPLISEAMDGLQPVFSSKGLTLQIRLPLEPRRITADRGRILQVLANLLGNAVKFTPKSGSVTLEVDDVEGALRFSVTDTGPGIAAQDLPRVFERHFRGNHASVGTGLGLYIARQIVESHRGTIWAVSEPGKGAAFSFTLPLSSAPGAEPAARE